jgi:glutamate--cysteine ligase
LPALWVGLLYDSKALDDAEALVSDWTPEEREYLRTAVTKDALQTPFRDGTVQDVAIVDGLMDMATSGVTRADEMLDKYVNKWGMNIDKVYDDYVF